MKKNKFGLIGVALLSLMLAACGGSNTSNDLPNASVTANSSVTTAAPGAATSAASGSTSAAGTTANATSATGATTANTTSTTAAASGTTASPATTAGATSGSTNVPTTALTIPAYPNATGIALGANLQQQIVQVLGSGITNSAFQAFTANDEPGRILGFYNNQLTGGQALLTPIPGTNDRNGNAPGGPNVTPSPNAAEGSIGKSGNLSFLAGLDGQIVNFVCPSGSGSTSNVTPGSSSNSNTGANSLAASSNSAANGAIRDCTQAGSVILSSSTPGNAANWSTTATANGNATVPAAPGPTPLSGPVTGVRIMALGPLDDNSLSRLTGLSPELSRSVRKGDTLVIIVTGPQTR